MHLEDEIDFIKDYSIEYFHSSILLMFFFCYYFDRYTSLSIPFLEFVAFIFSTFVKVYLVTLTLKTFVSSQKLAKFDNDILFVEDGFYC